MILFSIFFLFAIVVICFCFCFFFYLYFTFWFCDEKQTKQKAAAFFSLVPLVPFLAVIISYIKYNWLCLGPLHTKPVDIE